MSAGVHAECRKIMVCGILDHLNYCEIFIVYTSFLNVVLGCIIQYNVLWVGRPSFTGCNQSHILSVESADAKRCYVTYVTCVTYHLFASANSIFVTVLTIYLTSQRFLYCDVN
jgi:hypothetical protein